MGDKMLKSKVKRRRKGGEIGMKRLNILLWCAIAITMCVIAASIVNAQAPPSIPCFIEGGVKINNEPAPIGTVVTAEIEGDVKDTCTLEKSGEYSLIVEGPNSGNEIKIYVNGVFSGESVEWKSGGVYHIDLVVFMEKVIFDTGAPSNPYPSIFGTHEGTITPNQTIAISTLYTYPCSDTGGHTEYARIWNSSWVDMEAHWNGYKGDWHNISFEEPFTLQANLTYNYTIRTGSYPKIHHTDRLEVDNAAITCTKFVDANGRTYDNWIPAIKLFW